MAVPKKRTSRSKKKIRKNVRKGKAYRAAIKAFSLAKSISTGHSKSFYCIANDDSSGSSESKLTSIDLDDPQHNTSEYTTPPSRTLENGDAKEIIFFGYSQGWSYERDTVINQFHYSTSLQPIWRNGEFINYSSIHSAFPLERDQSSSFFVRILNELQHYHYATFPVAQPYQHPHPFRSKTRIKTISYFL